MTANMTIDDLITAQMQIARMNVVRESLVSAVDAATQGLSDVTGYKATIARAKLRDATTVLTEHDQMSAELKGKIESNDPKIWFAGRYALYMLEREKLEAVVAAAAVHLLASQEESKKSAWKWKGKPQAAEPTFVLAARASVAAATARVATLDKNHADVKKFIDGCRVWDKEEAEMQTWFAGGATPASVRAKQEAEQAELDQELVTLKRGPCYIEDDVNEEIEDDRKWVSMTAEEYFQSLMPTVVVETTVQSVAMPRGLPKTPAWITRITVARAARKTEPQLMVSEVA